MKDTKVYRSSDVGSDHYVVYTTVKLRLRTNWRKRKELESSTIRPGWILKAFSIALKNRYQVLEDEGLAVEENEGIEF